MANANKPRSWAEYVAQADHRIAIGATDVYIGELDADALDWSKCVGFERGGSHRLDLDTTVIFVFEEAGLTGRWFFEMEDRDANGRGEYRIATDRIMRLLELLGGTARADFLNYLADASEKVHAKGKQFLAVAHEQFGAASALEELVRRG